MNMTTAIITISDACFCEEREDETGPVIAEMIREMGFPVEYRTIIPSDRESIREELIRCADEKKMKLILTLGGTGFSRRDITLEVTREVLEKEVPGIPYLMMKEGVEITPNAVLSRMTAGIRGKTMIINLPGKVKAAKEDLQAIQSILEHAMLMLG